MNPKDKEFLEWIVQEMIELGGVSRADLLNSKSRCNGHIAFCRQAAMALAREFTDVGTISLGAYFNRHHTSVCHAVDVVKAVLLLPDNYARARAKLYLAIHGRLQQRMRVSL